MVVCAKDLMTTRVITVGPDEPVSKAINLMLEHHISGLPVVDDTGQLLGVISEFDVLELVWDGDPGDSEVYRYMSRNVHTIDENADLDTVAERFRTLGVRRLPVLAGERIVGIISRHDLLDHLCRAEDRSPVPNPQEGANAGGTTFSAP